MSSKVYVHFTKVEITDLENQEGCTHIAMRPEATYQLFNSKTSFSTFEDLNQKHFFLLNTEMTNLYSDWCGAADSILGNSIAEIREGSLSPFRASSLFIRKNFFKFYNEYFRVKTLLESFPDATFYYFNESESILFHHIVELLGPQTRQRFVSIGGEVQDLKFYQIDLPPINLHRSWKRLLKDVIKMSKFGYQAVLESLLKRPLRRKPKTLALGLLYDGEDIIKGMIQSKHDCLLFSLMRFKKSRRTNQNNEVIKAELIEGLKNHPWTTVDGLNFSSLFIPFLNKFVDEVLPLSQDIYDAFIEISKNFEIRSAFTSMPTLETQVIFRKCTLLDIPSFQAVHGGTLGVYKYFPPMPNSFLANPGSGDSFLIVYSDWLKKELEEYKQVLNDFSPKLITLGSPYFEGFHCEDRV